MDTNQKTPSQILFCAADLIEKRGRAYGAFEGGGQYCMAGAVRVCGEGNCYTHTSVPTQQAMVSLSLEILKLVPVPAGKAAIAFYNDNRNRSDATIVNLMRRVAKKLAEQEEANQKGLSNA